MLEGLTEQVKGLKQAYSKEGSLDGLTTIDKKSTQMDVTPDSYSEYTWKKFYQSRDIFNKEKL